MTAYYNEFDPFAAQWLRNLIAAGHIAPGDVDERSIYDVHPDDLKGYVQCHFFAGIGIWSAGLRRIGWPDDRQIWSGSCSCQPFSAAGKNLGFTDERHVWPAFFHLITARRPKRIVGEQVSSKDGLAWFDLIQADLEGADYSSGAVDLCSPSVGAPNIRQRGYWMAYANDAERGTGPAGRDIRDGQDAGRVQGPGHAEGCSGAGGLADTVGGGATTQSRDAREMLGLQEGHRQPDDRPVLPGRGGCDGRLADANGGDTRAEREQRSGQHGQQSPHGPIRPCGDGGRLGDPSRPRLEGIDLRKVGDERAASERTGATSWVGDADGFDGSKVGQSDDAQREQRPTIRRGEQQPARFGTTSGIVGGDRRTGDDRSEAEGGLVLGRPGPVNGFWDPADWVLCRDPDGPKWRAVEPWAFPLASGSPARVGRLRAYGNACNLEVATAFLDVAAEVMP